MSSNNPYTKAAGAYGTTAASTDQRALEGQILLQAAQKLETLAKRLQDGEKPSLEEVDETLRYNRKLWQVFVDDMQNPEHLLPQDIKNNVASLAMFVFKRTQEILFDTTPEKFTALISINRSIASGLMKKPPQPEAAAKPEKPHAAPLATDSMA